MKGYYPVGIYTSPFVYYQSLSEPAYTKSLRAQNMKAHALQGAQQFLDIGDMEYPRKTRAGRATNEKTAAAALEFLRQAAGIERGREKVVIRANIDKISEGEIKEKLLAALNGSSENYYDFILALNASIKGVEEAKAQAQRELERLTEYKRRYNNFRNKIKQMGKNAKDLTPDDIAMLRESKDTDIWDERIAWTTQQQRVGTSLITVQNGKRVANIDAIFKSLYSRQSQIAELSRGLLEDNLPQILQYAKDGSFELEPRRLAVIARLITQKYNELLIDELGKELSDSSTLRYRKGEYAATKSKLGPAISQYINELLNTPNIDVVLDNYARLYNLDDGGVRDVKGLQYRYRQLNQTVKNAYQTYKNQGGELSEKQWRANNKIDKNYLLRMVSALDAVSVQIHYISEVNSAEEQRQAFTNGITEVIGKKQGATDVITRGAFIIEAKTDESKINELIKRIEKQWAEENRKSGVNLEELGAAKTWDDLMKNAAAFAKLHEEQEKALQTIIDSLTEEEKGLITFKGVFNIHNSVKDYATIDVKTDAFSGATLGENFDEQLANLSQAAYSAGLEQDTLWLRTAIINTASGLIGEKNKPILENYLAIFASFFMFTDAIDNIAAIAKEITTKITPSVSEVHVYNLDGNYFPQSYVLQRLYDSLSVKQEEYMREQFSRTNTAVQVRIHNNYQTKANFITHDDYKEEGNWVMDEWFAEASAALSATTLSMTIMKNFISELENIFNSF